MTSVQSEAPRTGPCNPWVSAAQVLAQENLQPPLVKTAPSTETAATMATIASEVLYGLSGRQFTGQCGPVTVRPVSRPTDLDTRFGYRGFPQGFISAGQASTAYGNPGAGAINYFGTAKPSEIELGSFPVISVTQVKIDGISIPPNEYYLQDRRTLIRKRPTASSTPTARYGWPVNQLLDLPDDQPGTFSVTYTYGSPPPAIGVRACLVLATQLTLNEMGADNSLPQRITSIQRQGLSVAVIDVMDFFSKGLTGIYEVDLFVSWANPTKVRNRPMVWSPDMGRPRRMP